MWRMNLESNWLIYFVVEYGHVHFDRGRYIYKVEGVHEVFDRGQGSYRMYLMDYLARALNPAGS